MTKEQARQSELKKMELCEPCAGIQRNWRRAPGHPELMQGVNRKEPRRHGAVTVTRYVCERCAAVWASAESCALTRAALLSDSVSPLRAAIRYHL